MELRRDAGVGDFAGVGVFEEEGESAVGLAEDPAETGADGEEALGKGLPVSDGAEDDQGVALRIGEKEGELLAEGELAVVEEAEAAAGEVADGNFEVLIGNAVGEGHEGGPDVEGNALGAAFVAGGGGGFGGADGGTEFFGGELHFSPGPRVGGAFN